MEPLSHTKRYVYLSVLIFLFVVLVPITLLYSSGYRIGDGFALVKTGGIYVGLDTSGATLLLDGKAKKGVGILKKGFFVQDLVPRVYHVVVKKEGYRTWQKIIEVKPKLVSEMSAFVLPDTIPYETLSTSSPEYANIAQLFATSTESSLLSSEYASLFLATPGEKTFTEAKRKGGVVLWREGGSIFARWVDSNSSAPSYFCENGVCDKKIMVGDDSVQFFDFHPLSNELLLFVKGDVVIMTEIDPRVPRNAQTLYDAPQVLIRTLGGSIFVKDGKTIRKFRL